MTSAPLLLVLSALAGEPPTGTVAGVILEADTHGPLPAVVRVDVEGPDDPQVLTDPRGAFRLTVAAGTWPVTVTPAGGGTTVTAVLRVEPGVVTEMLVSWRTTGAPVLTVEEPPPTVSTAETVVLGELIGTVRDAGGIPVAGARLYVRGQPVEAITDDQGRFTLTVPVGEHDLTVLRAGFATRTLRLAAGEEARSVDVELVPAGVTLDALTITAPRIVGSTAGLLEERRQATGVTETLGAEQMRKSGDSNAAAALRRVTGLTVVAGRFVFVRGLGDRYAATLLDGSLLPSPEPERRTVPLDLFPASVLESVVVDKTFSPDRSAEFGGGIVGIRTKAVPSAPVLQVSGSIGGTHGTTFRQALSGPRGPADGLGFGAGPRALPDAIAALGDRPVERRGLLNPDGLDADELERLGESLPNHWSLTPRTVLPDGSLAIAGGRSWAIPGGPRVGLLLGGHWGSTWDLEEATRNVYGVSNGAPVLQRATTYADVQQRVQLGGLGVLGARWAEDHELASTTLLQRIGRYEAGVFEQDDPTSDNDRRRARVSWSEQQLVYEQLRGSHALPGRRPLTLDWRYAFARATRLEPERLEHTYARDVDGGWFASPTGTWNETSWGTLDDTLHEAGLDLSIGLPALGRDDRTGTVRFGGLLLDRRRSSALRRFTFDVVGTGLDLRAPIDELLVPGNIGASGPGDDGYLELSELRVSTDDYTANQRLYAGYAMAEVPFARRLRLMAGARVEASSQSVSTFELGTPKLEPVHTTLATVDVLPAASLTVAVGSSEEPERMLLRVAYGRTLSRPEFRELAPVQYIDPRTGTIVFGEPGLGRGLIDNLDLRWEWYFRPGESVSVAGFFKDFTDPIEEVALPIAGSNTSRTLRNAAGARNLGVEVDFRVTWGLLHPKLTDLYLAGNAAWIHSRIRLADEASIDTSRERPLQGQSPWVVNLQLGWDEPDRGFAVALLYNASGPRIVDVGQQGVPDTYEEPVHRLDLVGLAPVADGLQLQLRASNLLDSPSRRRTGNALAEEIREGFAVRLGLQWTPDLARHPRQRSSTGADESR